MIFLLLPMYAMFELLFFAFFGFGEVAYSLFFGLLSLIAIKFRLAPVQLIAALFPISILFAAGLNGIVEVIGNPQSPMTNQVYRDGEFVNVERTFPWILSGARFLWFWLLGGAGLYWNLRNNR